MPRMRSKSLVLLNPPSRSRRAMMALIEKIDVQRGIIDALFPPLAPPPGFDEEGASGGGAGAEALCGQNAGPFGSRVTCALDQGANARSGVVFVFGKVVDAEPNRR